jgi:hypothetical protein
MIIVGMAFAVMATGGRRIGRLTAVSLIYAYAAYIAYLLAYAPAA